MAYDIPTGIPSYLSETIFRVYEPHIAKGVAAWPQETEYPTSLFRGVDDRPISGNTFCARFRDAIASVLKFDWESTSIDKVKMQSLSGQYSIAMDPTTGSVWWRSRLRKQRPTQYTAEMRARTGGSMPYLPATANIPPPMWKDWSPEEVASVCVLLDKQRVTGPYTLEGKVDGDLSAQLETRFNVALTYDEATNRTYIV